MANDRLPQPQKNSAGRAGLIVAIITVLYNSLGVIVSSMLPAWMAMSGGSARDIGILMSLVTVGGLLLALTTAVLGAVGASRRGQPKLEAGIALGVGGAGSIGGLISLLAPPLIGLLMAV